MLFMSYPRWFSWVAFLALLCLPLLSLLVSLPAMLTTRLRVEVPPAVTAGTPVVLRIVTKCLFPVPMCRMAVQTYHTTTCNNWLLDVGSHCPTRHCGALNFRPMRGWIYDYMGLFRLPLQRLPKFRLLLRPTPLEVEAPDMTTFMVNSWRPKMGGGFAENHELRLYRPGDSLQQIHWKLSAKTNELILREPMIPDHNRLLLWLTLNGTPQEMDRKLGRLLWLAEYLHQQDLAFDILAYTAQGPQQWHVKDEASLHKAMDSLLCYGPYPGTDLPQLTLDPDWQYYIGGEADEKV